MRTLNQTEVMAISGGYSNKGYNFSFIVENAVTWAIPCFAVGLLTGKGETMIGLASIGAIVGGGYAVTMMVVTALDEYVFPRH